MLGIKAFSIFSSLLVSLLFLEGVIRVFDLPPKKSIRIEVADFMHSNDPTLLYVPKDFKSIRFKESDSLKILMVGDSLTAGHTLAKRPNVLFSHLIKKRIQKQTSKRVEILNRGVPGYNTAQEVRLLELENLKPDVVILTFCLNDFWNNADAGVSTYFRIKHNKNELLRYLDSIASFSRLFLFVRYRLSSIFNDENGYSEKRVEDAIKKVSLLSKREGYIVFIAVVPHFFDKSFEEYSENHKHKLIERFTEGLEKVYLIDTLEHFKKASSVPMDFSTDGEHLNEKGHEVFSHYVSEKIIEKLF